MKLHPSMIKAIHPVRRYRPLWQRVFSSPRALVYRGWHLASRPTCSECGGRHFFKYHPSATERICCNCKAVYDATEQPVAFKATDSA